MRHLKARLSFVTTIQHLAGSQNYEMFILNLCLDHAAMSEIYFTSEINLGAKSDFDPMIAFLQRSCLGSKGKQTLLVVYRL